MPKKEYPKLTEQEKQEIIQRHREMVEEFNAVLPDEMKLSIDEHLEERLNDEKQVAIYRIGQEIKEKERRQKEIRDSLEQDYGKYKGAKKDAFSRSLRYGFKTDDSFESKQYNIQMYKDYLNNQDKLAYVRYKDVLDFNPQELYDCGEDPLKLMEYYQKNDQLVKDAFVMNSCLSNVDIVPDLKKALPTMKEPMETLNQLSIKAKAAGGIEYFACPPLSIEQIMMLRATKPALFDINTGNETFRSICLDIENNQIGTVHQYLSQFGQNGREPTFRPGYFLKNKPVKTDPETEETKEVTFAEYLKNKDNENYELDYRDPFEVERIEMVSKTYSNLYAKNWQDRFVDHVPSFFNYNKFDISDMESKINGNIFQKIGRIFKGNSRQFDAMMKAFKNFNDPKHPDYMNESKLRDSADTYLKYKQAQGYHAYEYKTIEGKRMAFAASIIDTCDNSITNHEDIRNEIDGEIMDNYENIRQPFLVESDVEEFEVREDYVDENVPSDVLENDKDLAI